MTKNNILIAIRNYAASEGGGFKNWYCGIAADPKIRMFKEHNVPEKDSWWITANAGNETDARDTEKYLLSLGFTGGEGGGDFSTIHVYAYKILPTTIE